MFHILKSFFGIDIEVTIARKSRRRKNDEIFVKFLKARIDGMERNSVLCKGKSYALNSINNYRKILRIWPDFEKSIGAENLRFSEITLDVYSMFMDFCNRRNYMESTKYQYGSLLKAVMNSTLEDGVSTSTTQNKKGFVTHHGNCVYKKVYLSKDEILSLAGLDLSDNPLLMKVRDVFLVGCYCGQRFSDYSRICIDEIETINIDGREFRALRKVQRKTGRTVMIPMLDNGLIDIMKRWGGELPHISISTLNSKIKTICRMAGIDGSVVMYLHRGGKRIREVKRKYELVSSHTARRSHITNLYMEGKLSVGQIRSISGHSSEESFNKYLCQNLEEEAREIIRRYIG